MLLALYVKIVKRKHNCVYFMIPNLHNFMYINKKRFKGNVLNC